MKPQKYLMIFVPLLLSLWSFPVSADLTVLVLAGNTAQAEFPALEQFNQVGNEKLVYEQTKDRTLPGLDGADLLWLGQGEVCENAYFLDAATENRILTFVEQGGIVISVGQDSDDGRPCETGWFPADMTGVERGGVDAFQVTGAKEVDGLFTTPNNIGETDIHFDDTWTDPDPSIILLATINGGGDIGVGLLHHGKGAYLITGMQNEAAGEVTRNAPLMENLIYYAVKLLESQSVEARGKLPIAWGHLKSSVD